MNSVCGIYSITNKINGKRYIGQSININRRFIEHKNDPFNINCKDYDMAIYRAIRKYGLDNFNFEILEQCDKSELNDKEIYWIDYYNSYNNGYNCTRGGNSDHTHLGKKVEVYSLDGEYIRSYCNVTEAAKDIGVSRITIYQILYGHRLSTKGYQFKYANSDVTIVEYNSRQGGSIPIVQLNDRGDFIAEYKSTYDAHRKTGFDTSSLTKCCKKHHGDQISGFEHVGGYIWKYKDDAI